MFVSLNTVFHSVNACVLRERGLLAVEILDVIIKLWGLSH